MQTSDLRALLAARLAQAFFEAGKPELNTDPASPAGQLLDIITGESEAAAAALLFLAGQFNPKAAEGIWQDALGYIYFITRKMSEPTMVTCQLRGLPGTRVPWGSMVEDADRRRYVNTHVTGAVLDADGRGEAVFRCTEPGPKDVGPHAVTRIITTVPGWDTVDNAEAGVMGRDLETRGDFEHRRAESVAKNAHGTVMSLYGALHDLAGVAGVIDVQVLENIGPDPIVKYGVTVPGHGVTICIFGGRDEDIAELIYRKKDAGCDTGGNTEVVYVEPERTGAVYRFKILRPSTVNFWVKVKMSGEEPLTEGLVNRIKQAVSDDFHGLDPDTMHPRVGLASEVFASRFYCPVLNLGVKSLAQVTIALGPNPAAAAYGLKVTINGNQEPALALANVLVELV
jgi:uncharacterized phage protein gp47/JayE